jgi:hypothetical protein
MTVLAVPPNENTEPEKLVVATVLYDLGMNFELHLYREVMISYQSGLTSTTSHRTTLISGHNYKCKVMSNGFVEITNEVGTILIPMENVISIVRKKVR